MRKVSPLPQAQHLQASFILSSPVADIALGLGWGREKAAPVISHHPHETQVSISLSAVGSPQILSCRVFWFASFEVERGVVVGGSTEKTRGNTFQRLARKTHQLCCISHGPWLPAAGVESQDLFCTHGNRDLRGGQGNPMLLSDEKAGKGKSSEDQREEPGPGLWKWKN